MSYNSVHTARLNLDVGIQTCFLDGIFQNLASVCIPCLHMAPCISDCSLQPLLKYSCQDHRKYQPNIGSAWLLSPLIHPHPYMLYCEKMQDGGGIVYLLDIPPIRCVYLNWV